MLRSFLGWGGSVLPSFTKKLQCHLHTQQLTFANVKTEPRSASEFFQWQVHNKECVGMLAVTSVADGSGSILQRGSDSITTFLVSRGKWPPELLQIRACGTRVCYFLTALLSDWEMPNNMLLLLRLHGLALRKRVSPASRPSPHWSHPASAAP